MFHFKNNLNLNHLNKRLSSHRLFKMVNPYALNTRQPAKPQIQLGQSQALKKFEKFQAKYQASASGASQSNKFRKRNDDDDDDDDDEDDDSLFKNAKKTANKFMKKKQTEAIAQHGTDSESDSDQTFTESKHSEMSIGIDRSSTPVPAKRQSQQLITKIPTANRSPSRIRSAASSVSSIRSLNKRSVKFVQQDSNQSYSNDEQDESTILEDIMSRNLILDIDDLEANATSFSKKKSKRRMSKSPLAMAAQKRSESVTSIIEDNEEIEEEDAEDKHLSSITSSDHSLSMHKNLIFDVNELAKSLSQLDDSRKMTKNEKKEKKSSKKKLDSSEHSSDKKKKNKEKSDKKHKKKGRKTPTTITTDKSTTTIETESITDNDVDEVYEVETVKTESDEEPTRTKTNIKQQRFLAVQRSYNSDFETEATSAAQLKSRKQLSFAEFKQTNNAQIQVDPTDLLKNSDMLNSINVYNPSSILLATTSHLNTAATLKDLNQLTGYTMINQAFNDLIKMNLSFVSNFLISQRNLYEQQIKSIRPKEVND